ncbi:hypothetical protein ACHAPO_008054 [Fusarium lateritium]
MLINNPDYPNGSADITTQPAQHSNNANLSTELTEDSENENENLGKLSTGKATQICPDIRALGMTKRVVGVSRRTCLRPQKIPDLPRGHQWDGVRPIEEIRHIYDFKFDAEPSPNRSHAPFDSQLLGNIYRIPWHHTVWHPQSHQKSVTPMRCSSFTADADRITPTPSGNLSSNLQTISKQMIDTQNHTPGLILEHVCTRPTEAKVNRGRRDSRRVEPVFKQDTQNLEPDVSAGY